MIALTVVAMLVCIAGAGYANDREQGGLCFSLAVCAFVLFIVLCILGK